MTAIKKVNAELGVTREGTRIIVSSRFTISQMKSIGARYDKKLKHWSMYPLVSNIKNLVRLFPQVEMSPNLKAVLASPTGYRIRKDVKDALPERLWLNAQNHQKEALQRMYNSPHNGYLLELGKRLGKSFTAIAFAEARKAKRVLIVCNLNLIDGWQKQIKQWLDEDSTNSHGVLPKAVKWNVTNYETLRNYDYSVYPWDLVIVDESVQLQHRGQTTRTVWVEGKPVQEVTRSGTQRTDDVKALRAACSFMLFLSGSPISRHADGLYPQFNCLFPHMFTSYWRFVYTYCDTLKTAWGTKIVGTKKSIDFREEFKDISYSVRTEDVFDIGIDFVNIDVEMNDDQIAVYDELMMDFEAELDGAFITTATKLSRLIRFAEVTSNLANLGNDWNDSSAKSEKLMEILPDYEVPAIIWVHWKKTGDWLYHHMSMNGYEVGIFTGTQKSESVLQKFKDGELDYIILSLTSGKYGLTLPAKTMFYHDKIWDGDAYNQSLARAVDTTQKESRYTVVSLICPNTVDDLIADNLSGKMESISTITDEDLIRLLGGLEHDQREGR